MYCLWCSSFCLAACLPVWVCLSVFLLFCLFVVLSFCLSVWLSFCLSVWLSVSQSVIKSISQSVRLTICPSDCLTACSLVSMSVLLTVFPSTHLSLSLCLTIHSSVRPLVCPSARLSIRQCHFGYNKGVWYPVPKGCFVQVFNFELVCSCETGQYKHVTSEMYKSTQFIHAVVLLSTLAFNTLIDSSLNYLLK